MTYNVNPVAQLNQSPARGELKQRFCRIKVRDLVLLASIGIFDREKAAQQRVRINVDLKVAESPSPIDDNIANVLCYKDIIDGIRNIIAEGHINLVETLAERIAQMCLADGRVALARIGVEKLDIEPDAAAVGVEIERSRLDF